MSEEAITQTEDTQLDSGIDSPKEETQGPTLEELQKKLDAITKAQQGSDRMVTDLKKQLEKERVEKEELKKSSMSIEEKIEYEKRLIEEKEKAWETEKRALQQENLKKDFLLKKGISSDLAPYINGDTPEALEESARNLLEGINAEAEKRVAEKLKKSTPGAGESPAQKNNLTLEEIAQLPAGERLKALEASGYR
jgi:hypothetical protein